MNNTGNSDAQLPFEDGHTHSFLSGSLLEILIVLWRLLLGFNPKTAVKWSASLGEVPGEMFLAGPAVLLTDMVLLHW